MKAKHYKNKFENVTHIAINYYTTKASGKYRTQIAVPTKFGRSRGARFVILKSELNRSDRAVVQKMVDELTFVVKTKAKGEMAERLFTNLLENSNFSKVLSEV